MQKKLEGRVGGKALTHKEIELINLKSPWGNDRYNVNKER